VTDAVGRVFISYRRSRSAEVALLVQALRDVGLPTWQDVADLRHEPVEDAVRARLRDPSTAGAVLFLTPEVRNSPFIRRVEVPEILRRHSRGDGFWLLPVLAAGLSKADAPTALAAAVGADEMARWNPHLAGKPFSPASAAAVAAAALRERVVAVHAQLDRGAPLRVRLDVGAKTSQPDDAFVLDWTAHFSPLAAPARWDTTLLPALATFRRALSEHAPGRTVAVTGTPSLPAAFALGWALREPPPMNVVWLQRMRAGRKPQTWSLSDAPDSTRATQAGWTVRHSGQDVDGRDLAVLINVTNDAGSRYAATRSTLPQMRGTITVDHRDAVNAPPDQRPDSISINGGAEAASLARLVRNAVRNALDTYGPLDAVHVFLAGPTGLAMLIGQLTNTLPPIVTYDAPDTSGVYQRAATLAARGHNGPRAPKRPTTSVPAAILSGLARPRARIAAGIALLVVALAIAIPFIVVPEPPAVLGKCRQIGVFTGQEDSPYHAYGQVLKRRIEEKFPGSSVTVQRTSGTSDNINRLRDPGSCDVAVVQLNVAVDARIGTYDFKDHRFEELQLVGPIWFDLVHLAVRRESDVHSAADLCGGETGKIATGLGNSGTKQIGEVLFRQVPGCALTGRQKQVTLAEGLGQLRDGTVDAVLWAGGSPTGKIRDAITRDGLEIRMLPTDGYLPGMQKEWDGFWRQNFPGLGLAFTAGGIYEAKQIEPGDYPGVDRTRTVAAPNGVVVNKSADSDLVRFVVESLDRDRADFERALWGDSQGARRFPGARETVATSPTYCNVPLHDAAAGYYRGVGVRPACRRSP
jgi:TRAP transporter TAXI family solute receptor